MTAAFNLAQLANNLNTSGQLDATDGLTGSVPVANGGTGLATLTANNVILGNGTSAPTFVAPGASGNVLLSNGTTWQSGTPSFGALKYDLYTSGSGTWTCPAGVTRVKVVCVGGGGGGGGGNDDKGPLSGGSGGVGGASIGIYTVTPGTGYAYTVGAGGAGSNTTTGGSGNTSSFGSTLLSATGGAGGVVAVNTNGANGANGAGASGVTGNGITGNGIGGCFLGSTQRDRAASITAPLTWTASSGLVPGACGQGELATAGNNAAGGVGGAIYIEYVG